jgi:Ca2+-binding EF-hand superfamily protein
VECASAPLNDDGTGGRFDGRGDGDMNSNCTASFDTEDTKSSSSRRKDAQHDAPVRSKLPLVKPSQYDAVSRMHGFLSQKDIPELVRQTNYNRRELYVIYARFKALCALSPTPEGIDKTTFNKGIARLAVEDELFVNRVFGLVDEDGSGQIEWDEFLTAMAALEKGNPEIKNRFCFQTYDLDEDGFIGWEDLAQMFRSSSMLSPDATTDAVVDAFVSRVFRQLGVEDKGKISLDDLTRFMETYEGDGDVWDVFGRSMLKDFNDDDR